MSLTFLIAIMVVGMVLLILEIVALPGGVAGIIGGALLAAGIWMSYTQYGAMVGNVALVSTILVGIALLCYMLKARTWNRFSLNEESNSKVNQIDEERLTVGTRGITIARLAPTGKADFDGRLEEVHAVNKFIDPDRPIEIVAIEGYRIDVKEVE